MRAEDCYEGQPVIYRAHPGAPAEDGEVVRVNSESTVMVAYRNGPQAGKTCSTRARDLEPAR